MGSVNRIYGGNYLKAADLEGKRLKTVIEEIEEKEFAQEGKPKQAKLIAWLRGQDGAWVLNHTNAQSMAEIYGDDWEDWSGKPVVLKVERVQYGKDKVPGIRVDEDATRALHEAPRSKKPAPAFTQAEADEIDDDEIPF